MVQEVAVSPLPAWQNFYVIIGTAAATLTGLMFVVITLVQRVISRSSSGAFSAYSTPTVVHFSLALLVAALLSAPWQALWNVGLLLGLTGLGGVIYNIIVVRRMRRETRYQAVLEDWLWYAVFPLVAYSTLFVAAIVLPGIPIPALFCIAAATALLLFIGIHNAWDAVTYIALGFSQPEDNSQD
jgi:hypothetical protein